MRSTTSRGIAAIRTSAGCILTTLLVACSGGGGDTSADSGSLGGDGGSAVGTGNVGLAADYANGSGISSFVNINGSFVAGASGDGSAVATVDAGSGSCRLTQQPHPAAPTLVTFVSAGTLTVSNGVQSFIVTPSNATLPDAGSSVDYQLSITDAGTLSAGEAFTFVASGATAPAFSTSVDVPDLVTLTQPAIGGASSSLVIPRSADLSLTWSGGGIGDVLFTISQTVGETSTIVSCTYPGAARAGVVPADLLGRLTASSQIDAGGSHLRSTSLSLSTISRRATTVGGWTVSATILLISLTASEAQVTVQ
jgi:hypothetical protein